MAAVYVSIWRRLQYAEIDFGVQMIRNGLHQGCGRCVPFVRKNVVLYTLETSICKSISAYQ